MTTEPELPIGADKAVATPNPRVVSLATKGPDAILGRWLRRGLVVSAYVVLLATLLALFVPLLALAAACDLLRRQPWTLTRALVFFAWYLVLEIAGVAAAFAIWLLSGPWSGRNRETWLASNYALQAWWARMLGGGGFVIFGMRTEIEGTLDGVGERPVLVFVRHASTADTILAAMLLANPRGLRLRYVLKRELLWDPCLDVVGNRLPNVFVRRDSEHREESIASIRALAANMRAGEGVLIYPEGTRFTSAKKQRIVQKLRAEGRAREADEADSLRHVLRPRPGGALALLEGAPEADVVFLTHTGFEGAASFDRFFNGALVGRTIHVQLRTVRAQQIPAGQQARTEWLMEQWRAVDEFVDSHRRGG